MRKQSLTLELYEEGETEMSRETLKTTTQNGKKSKGTLSKSFETDTKVSCSLVQGSLTITITPSATEIIQGKSTTVSTYTLDSTNKSKGFNIKQIVIIGDNDFNQFDLLP